MTTIKCAAGCGNDVEVRPGDEGMDHLCDTCAPEQCKRTSCTRREEQLRARIAELEAFLRDTEDVLHGAQHSIAKLEGTLRLCKDALAAQCSRDIAFRHNAAAFAIAKIKEVLGGE